MGRRPLTAEVPQCAAGEMVTTVETAIDAALAHVGIANLMSYHAAEYVANEQLRIVLEQFEPSLRPLRARVRVNAVQVAVCVP